MMTTTFNHTARHAAGNSSGAAQAGAAWEHGDVAGDVAATADAGAEDVEIADAEAAVRPEKRTLPPRMRESSERLRDAYTLMTTVDTPHEPESFQAA
jgi:hypothetical protein